MLSKNAIKLVKSLASKKSRLKESLFLVEGDKNVSEVLISNFKVEKLFATNGFLNRNKGIIKNSVAVEEVSENEIKKASLLKNPQNSFAICQLPQSEKLPGKINDNLSLYLDGIQDPGNLGTIIRICDWFGIGNIFCSPDTTDVFNPKVIQASMGSFCRVKVWQASYNDLMNISKSSVSVILGTFLNGEDIYTKDFPEKIIIVMGNEGSGIRAELEKKIEQKIKIPEFPQNNNKAESLNVSVATAIICAEIMRRKNYSK